MIMELNINWNDITNLIHGPDGLRNRFDLDLRFCEKGDNHFAWRSENYKLIVIGSEKDISMIGLFMDNDKPANSSAKWTWQEITKHLSSLGNNKEENKTLSVTKEKQGKSGRHSYTEDIWAWGEIHRKGRPKEEVKAEWMQKLRANPKRADLVDPDSQWKEIKKFSWREGKIGENI